MLIGDAASGLSVAAVATARPPMAIPFGAPPEFGA
jgi:hypothetical protein